MLRNMGWFRQTSSYIKKPIVQPINILIVATSHDKMGDAECKTGLWLHELAIPYYIFKEVGWSITLASPKGGRVPLDPKSESIIAANSTTKRFLKEPEAISMLLHAHLLSTQKAEDFDILFLAGGHGTIWDFNGNEYLKKLVEDFNRADKLIAAISHGAAGLLSTVNAAGEPLVKGRQITCFSNSEEHASGLDGILPFLLEPSLIALGAIYTRNQDYLTHVVTDRNIITGQNPASSAEIARKLLQCMDKPMKKPEVLSH
jgi:putative intracellular protease/amidase